MTAGASRDFERSLRVLLVTRVNAYGRAGGDMTQLRFTKRALESRGVVVDVAPALDPDPRGYDLVHVFGVYDPQDTRRQIASCRRTVVPIALSPLWWDLFEYYGRSRPMDRILAGNRRRIPKRLAQLRAQSTGRFLTTNEKRKYAQRIALQAALMREADVLLPNSVIESHLIRKNLRLQDRPMVVVHQAVDVPIGTRPAPARAGVVCVARVEPNKNQAMLLYALRDLDVDVTLIGACYEPEYADVCRRYLSPRHRWIGAVERDEVLARLAACAVHVLPSWFEFPGIASLEAAAMGAHVVVGSKGTECEYFGEFAQYVDPEDPAGIRAAVERALALPARRPGDALDRRLAQFALDTVAARTLDGYRIALSAKRR
ncbi:MAG TPA: glycosyltransferase family 4 protein [Candidatus Acidoferrales bacterium]|nr:glycosyltransferase family 4 protein [Candidatus Acidoferrales bacterium]